MAAAAAAAGASIAAVLAWATLDDTGMVRVSDTDSRPRSSAEVVTSTEEGTTCLFPLSLVTSGTEERLLQPVKELEFPAPWAPHGWFLCLLPSLELCRPFPRLAVSPGASRRAFPAAAAPSRDRGRRGSRSRRDLPLAGPSPTPERRRVWRIFWRKRNFSESCQYMESREASCARRRLATNFMTMRATRCPSQELVVMWSTPYLRCSRDPGTRIGGSERCSPLLPLPSLATKGGVCEPYRRCF